MALLQFVLLCVGVINVINGNQIPFIQQYSQFFNPYNIPDRQFALNAGFSNNEMTDEMATCDPGFEYSPITRLCYLHSSEEKKNWYDASQHCEVKGASLASFDSRQGLNAVRSICTSYEDCWIGGISVRGAPYHWTDGTEWGLVSEQIKTKQPDPNRDFCLSIRKDDFPSVFDQRNSRINDCFYNEKSFICQKYPSNYGNEDDEEHQRQLRRRCRENDVKAVQRKVTREFALLDQFIRSKCRRKSYNIFTDRQFVLDALNAGFSIDGMKYPSNYGNEDDEEHQRQLRKICDTRHVSALEKEFMKGINRIRGLIGWICK